VARLVLKHMNGRQLGLTVAATALLTATSTLAAPAASAASGDQARPTVRNGRIAYDVNTNANGGGFDIFTVRPDGTGKKRLTWNRHSYDPAFAPGGNRIAYTRWNGTDSDIWVMGAGGLNKQVLITGPGDQFEPAWSPDATQIAYTEGEFGQLFVYTLATGTSTQLTFATDELGPFAGEPTWSPDGGRIAFHSYTIQQRELGTFANPGTIDVINSDGSARRQVTPQSGRVTKEEPDWSPDGKTIAYARMYPENERDPVFPIGLATIRPDGTDGHLLPQTGEWSPAWAPNGLRLAAPRIASDDPAIKQPGLWTMGPRGEQPQRVLAAFYIPRGIDWQPLRTP
jgi:Tol biopolymer transport system component